MSKNCFLHISDLHFSRYNGSKSAKEEICQFDIKKDIFNYISKLIDQYKIDAILISGDLEIDSCDDIILYFKEWLNKGSKIFITFGEHDTREKRDKFIFETRGLKGFYVFDELNKIQDPELGFQVYGMSCESKQEGFTKKFASLSNFIIDKPTVFLTHPCDLSKKKMIELGCNYYAVGHVHYHNIEQISNNIWIGRPGHMYSIWDGNGKAWPVGALLGNFDDNSIYIKWLPFPVPQTIRLYIDKFKQNEKGEMLFCVENCPEEKCKRLMSICNGDWKFEQSRGVFKGFYSPALLPTEQLVRSVLKLFEEDIFITPSDSNNMRKKYGYNRVSFTSKTLLKNEDIFNEFVERTFKATVTTG